MLGVLECLAVGEGDCNVLVAFEDVDDSFHAVSSCTLEVFADGEGCGNEGEVGLDGVFGVVALGSGMG